MIKQFGLNGEARYEVTKLMGLPGELSRCYFVTDPDGYDVEVIREF